MFATITLKLMLPSSFMKNRATPELPHALPRGRRRSPCLLEDLEVGLDEVRAVRPQGRLGLSSDRPLVLDEECHHRFPIDEDEAAALAFDVPQRNVLRDAGHERLVPLVDVRNEPRLHLPPHRLEEDLVDAFAVRALQALSRREAQDLRLRRADELSQGAVDLGPALDDLQSDRGRLAGPPGDAGPALDQRLPDRIELLELRALLLGNHLEDVVDGPRRISPGAVDRDLDQAARLEALEGAIRLHAVHAARSPRTTSLRRRMRSTRY